MAAIADAFSNIIAQSPLNSTFPKLGLPLEENEPLVTHGASEEWAKCELRIGGMTCGACVEVSAFLILSLQCTQRGTVNRRYAQDTTRHPLHQSGSAG